jgi:hypothetical protein
MALEFTFMRHWSTLMQEIIKFLGDGTRADRCFTEGLRIRKIMEAFVFMDTSQYYPTTDNL